MSTEKSAEDFKESLKGKKVPVLTLDTKWHQLFRKNGKTEKINQLEEEVNELLKRQGKLNNEIQSMKKEKMNLMNGIVKNMDEANNESESDGQDGILSQNQEKIKSINETIEQYEDELLDLPIFIRDANEKLMLEGMDIFYHQLMEMAEHVSEIDEWIKKIRVELKKNIIRKQEMEKQSQLIYQYLHSIFGPEIVEVFDMKYMHSLAQKYSGVLEENNPKQEGKG